MLGALIAVLEETNAVKLLLDGEKVLRNLFRESMLIKSRLTSLISRALNLFFSLENITEDLQLKFVEVGGLFMLKSFLYAVQSEVRSLSVNLILNLSAYHGKCFYNMLVA